MGEGAVTPLSIGEFPMGGVGGGVDYAMTESLWPALLTTALLGTERQALTLPSTSGPLGAVFNQLNPADTEGALLSAAGTVALYRRVGRGPTTESFPLPPPCESDESPRCSHRAGQHLALMLTGQLAEALPEWLRAVAQAGQRIPEEHLPALLAFGKANVNQQEAILPVLGVRGRWLAKQNSVWMYGSVGEANVDESVWQIGTRDERLALLKRLRAQNPTRAREVLLSTWEQEAPEDRAAFLLLLQINLSLDDEPFLESVLDDRRKEVRHPAADLLAHLSQSQLCQRMMERVRPLIRWTKSKTPHLAITPPEECTKEMQRDGVEAKARKGTGEKTWWFIQMLGMTPPAVWPKELSKPIPELIASALGGEWQDAFLEGWTLAAIRFGDEAWTEALAREWMTNDKSHAALAKADLYPALMRFPVARFEKLLAEALKTDESPLHDQHPAFWLLRRNEQPWSATLTRKLIASLRARIAAGTQKGQAFWGVRSLLKRYALQILPTLYDEISRGWPTEEKGWGVWEKDVEEMLALLQFRRDMLNVIGNS